ncbi:MAG: type B 50S ribosomal protein L31 [Verrucomicrobia bacterium]|nr:type B 50S ribosomal protein L31 [Verrucomicrobiota bacterium]
MKKQGHPPYQEILFVDSSTGFKFVCGSALQPKEKEMFEGKEYPVMRVSTSSASHPFWTKSNQFIDSEGRVDKFMKKYKKPVAVEAVEEVEDSSDKKKKKK